MPAISPAFVRVEIMPARMRAWRAEAQLKLALQRDIPVLLARHRIDLRLQQPQRPDHSRTRLPRLYDVVHVPALGRDEGIREPVAELLGLLRPHRALVVGRR